MSEINARDRIEERKGNIDITAHMVCGVERAEGRICAL